ncbi:MAG: hypothetical protein KME09_19435 [Pleurocapsa minor HA4230-MV1]|nr:hypothetical protein [Pleurocapsa minor HA4230-MV1]
MSKVISFKRGKTPYEEIVRLHKEGYVVICPLCKSELVFQESGVWCPKNPNHYEVHIYPGKFARKMREQSREWGIKETTKKLQKKGYTEEQIKSEIIQLYYRQPQSFVKAIDENIDEVTLDALPEELDKHIQFFIENHKRHGYKHIETTQPLDNEGYDIRKRVYIRFAKKQKI